jgi:hypothetical protein
MTDDQVRHAENRRGIDTACTFLSIIELSQVGVKGAVLISWENGRLPADAAVSWVIGNELNSPESSRAGFRASGRV